MQSQQMHAPHRVRELFMRQRIADANQIQGLLAEFGEKKRCWVSYLNPTYIFCRKAFSLRIQSNARLTFSEENILIDVYSWATPNGHKVHIMLEETELPYKVIAVDIGASDQFKPKFLKISPNNKIPAIVDHEGPRGEPFSLFESGAILLYLAEKTKQFLPRDVDQRFRAIEWLMFQVGGVGPMLGQAHHFRIYAPKKIKYAIDRYTNEANRLYGVMDRRLKKNAYLAGDKYTIADMATWPWLRSYKNQGVEMDDYPSVKRWFSEIEARPAVQRAIKVLADKRRPLLDTKAREVLFGATQYQRRK